MRGILEKGGVDLEKGGGMTPLTNYDCALQLKNEDSSYVNIALKISPLHQNLTEQ